MPPLHNFDATPQDFGPKSVPGVDPFDDGIDGVIPSCAVGTESSEAVNAAVGVGPVGADTGDLKASQFAVLF